MTEDWIESVAWNADGLVPAVAQDAASGEVLMLAWMSRESLRRTVETGNLKLASFRTAASFSSAVVPPYSRLLALRAGFISVCS